MDSVEEIVSVCMITYNHEKYIAQAIESVLNQKTSFKVKLIIGEDFSTDRTKEICTQFQDKYPEAITILPSVKNKGILNNFSDTLTSCRGKYIAICEGDDYWSDPDKLQNQFEFLEAHPEASICFHNAVVFNESNNTNSIFLKKHKQLYDGNDIIKRWTIPTASVFFRNILPEKLPSFMTNGTHGDLPLFLFLAAQGKICFIDKVMSVYRVNEGSITQSRFKGIDHNIDHINQLELMIDYFGSLFKGQLVKRQVEYYLSTSLMYVKRNDKNSGIKLFATALKKNPMTVFLRPLIILKIFIFLIKP